MKQPDLGKKIVELRKAKGLTQEELVANCNLSVRTLQRIESGEVEPRSYTVKIIFAALDYPFYDSQEIKPGKSGFSRIFSLKWPGQLYIQFIDLFNLKTNTMKKVSILTVMLFAVITGLFFLCTDGKAQSAEKVKKTIEGFNKNYIRWFNNGQLDSLLSLYSSDACLLVNGAPNIYGWEGIKSNFISEMSKGYKMMEINMETFDYADSIAIERGNWLIKFVNGGVMKGKYLTEWKLINGKWVTVNDMGSPEY